MNTTTYIDVIDTKTKTGPDTQRTVSLGMNQELRPGVLNLLGNLLHNSEITLDRANAEKLVKWINENILACYDRKPSIETNNVELLAACKGLVKSLECDILVDSDICPDLLDRVDGVNDAVCIAQHAIKEAERV